MQTKDIFLQHFKQLLAKIVTINSLDPRDLENETAAPSADIRSSETSLKELCGFPVSLGFLGFFKRFGYCGSVTRLCLKKKAVILSSLAQP